MARYRIRLESPKFWLSSVGWIIWGLFLLLNSIIWGIILSMAGLLLVGIPVFLIGGYLGVHELRKARKCMKFYCGRCDKKIVVYKYDYDVLCRRCYASHEIDWNKELAPE